MKTKTLATTSFLALLGLVAMPACASNDSGDDEVGETTDPGTDTDTGDGDGDGDTSTGDGDGDGDTSTGDGDGDGDTTTTEETGGDLPNGAACTSDAECASANCYVVPFLGGQCGECNEDADCADTTMGGCTPPNPFESNGSICNTGEAGGGCETTDVCMEGLTCGNVLSLLGLIELNTCGECATTDDCEMGTICAPIVTVSDFSGINTCITPGTLDQGAYCLLEGNGDEACMSGICSTVDIMGLAMIGACGACNSDMDCAMGETCTPGEFVLDTAELTGSTCG